MAGTDLLDKSVANWHPWKRQTTQHLKLCGLFGYLDGTVLQPDIAVEAKAHQNWKTNDNVILAYFGLRAAEGEQEELKKAMSAKDAWVALTKTHEKQGAMAQILLIQEAFALWYTRTEPLSATSLRLTQLLSCIYAIGIPSQDMFLSITMLNALTGEFANVHDHVATTMASLTDPLKPFESSSIRARLDLEQQLINNDTSQSSITLLSHTPGRTQGCSHKHSDKKCSNTKCPSPSGHTLPDCWAPGVGMEGKRDEVLASRKAKREARGKTGDPSATSSI